MKQGGPREFRFPRTPESVPLLCVNRCPWEGLECSFSFLRGSQPRDGPKGLVWTVTQHGMRQAGWSEKLPIPVPARPLVAVSVRALSVLLREHAFCKKTQPLPMALPKSSAPLTLPSPQGFLKRETAKWPFLQDPSWK